MWVDYLVTISSGYGSIFICRQTCLGPLICTGGLCPFLSMSPDGKGPLQSAYSAMLISLARSSRGSMPVMQSQHHRRHCTTASPTSSILSNKDLSHTCGDKQALPAHECNEAVKSFFQYQIRVDRMLT